MTKKILIACDSPRSLLDFRGKLIEQMVLQNEVSVFTPPIEQESIRTKLAVLGVTVYENHLRPSSVSLVQDLRYMAELYRLLRKLKPEVFFPYTFKPVIYGTIVARLCGIRRITPMLTGLGNTFLRRKRGPTLVQRITRALLSISLSPARHVHLILQNPDDYGTLRRSGVLKRGANAHVVNGSGVDLEQFTYSKPPVNPPSFLMVSRLINAKGVREFYEAAKLTRLSHPEATFTIIGAFEDNIDSISAELYEQIAGGNAVQYHGLVSDVRPFIEAASVVVLPSYYGEGVPRSLLEAMAMGRAIITCDSVGCRETINPDPGSRNGLLVQARNAKDLADKMHHYVVCPEDIVDSGRNGRAFVCQKFDVLAVNADMLRIMGIPASVVPVT
ncbi:glycosyltransferase family 1 protein [Pedobacter yulinensis]|uniref:Glycosyltransferase family 1 protein n=1 Tax=Pedobacter yulinensis TaxID=2126353 RepID=A0A2T3HLC4_9SPHI|nr:glycosyltransferase family 4 protein [Pedobacter yulinensis]PST83247.1 glycosyltransferase family 1 protein [Pedobacter yulinensis]